MSLFLMEQRLESFVLGIAETRRRLGALGFRLDYGNRAAHVVSLIE